MTVCGTSSNHQVPVCVSERGIDSTNDAAKSAPNGKASSPGYGARAVSAVLP